MDRSLTEIWAEKASAVWQRDFDDLSRERDGAQVARINRFLDGNGAFSGNTDKKNRDHDAIMEMAEIVRATQQRLYEEFMEFSAEAREFYTSGLKKIDAMEDELAGLEAEYERRTIRLSDGRAVYVDKSGNYVYKDGAGDWRALEEAAVPEAKAAHAKLAAPAITKQQKDNFDDYKENLATTKDTMNRNRQELDELDKKAEAGQLTEEDYQRAQERKQQDESALDSLSKKRDSLLNDLDSGNDIKSQNRIIEKSDYTDDDISMDIFADDSKRTVSASGSALEGAGQLTSEFASASIGTASEQPAISPAAPGINKPTATSLGMAG